MQVSEFKRRRRQLMGMMGPGSVAILPTSVEAVRNRDVHHRFRPDSDFYYLTGFAEPEAVMVLVPGRVHGEYILFCREKDPAKELWDGSRAGLEGAVAQYGADDAFPISDLDDILPGLLEERERVFLRWDPTRRWTSACPIGSARCDRVHAPACMGRSSFSRWIITCMRCACTRVAPR